MARAVLAVSTTAGRHAGCERILYHDLDVEQLGAVYEQVLDYEAREAGDGGRTQRRRLTLARTGDLRKSSGTFYTPRRLTDYLVRCTLAPLVHQRTAAAILNLRVVDSAMGSGAFLVATCRYLAAAVETALIREGEWDAADITEDDRVSLRRDVAQRCVYGVDLNPMAVQLARLSLWLATLCHDKPLTFLDHHLIVGDSLVGASLHDLVSRPPSRTPGRRPVTLPLFADQGFDVMLGKTLPARLRLALERDDDVDIVRGKESLLAQLRQREAPVSRWKSVFDLWCACWFWPGGRPPDAALYGDLAERLLHDRSFLPESTARTWIATSRHTAAARAFLHWELEFPEVFYDENGQRRPDAGFDAVIGNPPWDVVRADSGEAAVRGDRRRDAAQLVAFARNSGIYESGAFRSHTNRYQLFVERALQLSKPGGRIGLVLPSGMATDTGGGPLRRRLFDRASVDRVVGLDNRAGIFPIHRGLRFVALTATAGRRTEQVSCRFGISTLDQLEVPDDLAGSSQAPGVLLSRRLIERLSGDADLGIPEVASETDLLIVERISSTTPWLGAREGWDAHFGRELNASDDRASFVPATGYRRARVVLEGKSIAPFRVDLDGCRYELSPEATAALHVPRRTRLAYRDVASATNRLTLIAAMVPARAVTTHTLFVLRTVLPYERQLVLCALLNSYVANYLIRMRVNTHVTASLMARLPVPMPPRDGRSARLARLADACRSAIQPVESMEAYAELQAHVAQLYGLREDEFRHVLSTFPLVPADVKAHSLGFFEALQKSGAV